jgi:hypothetical protein
MVLRVIRFTQIWHLHRLQHVIAFVFSFCVDASSCFRINLVNYN